MENITLWLQNTYLGFIPPGFVISNNIDSLRTKTAVEASLTK
jgi:hypothetical protein